VIVRLRVPIGAGKHVGRVEIAHVGIGDRELGKEELFRPLNDQPCSIDVAVVVVGCDLAGRATIEVEAAVLGFEAFDRLNVEIKTANIERPSA